MELYDQLQLVTQTSVLYPCDVSQAHSIPFQPAPLTSAKRAVPKGGGGSKTSGCSRKLCCRLSRPFGPKWRSAQSLTRMRGQVPPISSSLVLVQASQRLIYKKMLRLQKKHLRPMRGCLAICFCLPHFTNPEHRLTDQILVPRRKRYTCHCYSLLFIAIHYTPLTLLL